MEEKQNLPSLENLQKRIDEAREKEEPPVQGAPDPMRIGLELVSGVAVGGVIGFYLDKWLETKPFLLILFLLLGAAAGFMNIYRLVKTPAENEEKNNKK